MSVPLGTFLTGLRWQLLVLCLLVFGFSWFLVFYCKCFPLISSFQVPVSMGNMQLVLLMLG